jgi:hypothetical protein
VYSTCTFCHASLGRNEALELFPVGVRLAFDQARGRLWVICPTCRQWNLSPLEERWEAIEAAEKLYRDSVKRVATDHIGLARLRDGTDLIRIGEPMRPEFAAWRYGDRFQRRWRRNIVLGGMGIASAAGYMIAGPILGLAVGGISALPFHLYSIAKNAYDDRKVVVRHRDAEGSFIVTRAMVGGARIVRDPASELGWGMRVMSREGDTASGRFAPASRVTWTGIAKPNPRLIHGPEALQAMRAMLPVLNASGGRARVVEDAVWLLEQVKSPDRVFLDGVKWSLSAELAGQSWELNELDRSVRLALEMAAHEETERQAMQGELAALEAVWRDAEEIAAIADSLTLPERITQRLERLVDGR